jgi:hypothetical protein
MTQADSVHSTPPTNTSKIPPVDRTRRRVLTTAAGIVALAISPASQAAASDPIFAAIEKHRRACDAVGFCRIHAGP